MLSRANARVQMTSTVVTQRADPSPSSSLRYDGHDRIPRQLTPRLLLATSCHGVPLDAKVVTFLQPETIEPQNLHNDLRLQLAAGNYVMRRL